MRTALFLAAGLLLLGAALLLGKLFSTHYPGATFVATPRLTVTRRSAPARR